MRIIGLGEAPLRQQPPFAATPRLRARVTVADATEAQLIYALPRALAAGDNYAVSAIRLRLRGANLGAAPDPAAAAARLKTQLASAKEAARAALVAAQQVVDSNKPVGWADIITGALTAPFGGVTILAYKYAKAPDSGTYSAWVTSTKQATEQTFPLLQRTFDQAAADPAYAKKWLETAKALRSQLTQVLSDEKTQGLLNALDFTISETLKELGAAAVAFKNLALNPFVILGVALAIAVGPSLVGRTVAAVGRGR